jgi:hypothetical protein
LVIGAKVSVILPRATFRRLSDMAVSMRASVEQLVAAAAERMVLSAEIP